MMCGKYSSLSSHSLLTHSPPHSPSSSPLSRVITRSPRLWADSLDSQTDRRPWHRSTVWPAVVRSREGHAGLGGEWSWGILHVRGGYCHQVPQQTRSWSSLQGPSGTCVSKCCLCLLMFLRIHRQGFIGNTRICYDNFRGSYHNKGVDTVAKPIAITGVCSRRIEDVNEEFGSDLWQTAR